MKHPRPRLRRAVLTTGTIIGTVLATTFLTAAASAAPTITFKSGVLTILGDAGNNGLKVGSTPAGPITLNGVVVVVAGAPAPTRSNVSLIHLDGGAGDDTLIFDETNGALPRGEFVGGPGRNAMTGGSAADSFVGGTGVDRVIGGPGADTVSLGGGTDQFTWNFGDGNDRIDGGADGDTLLVNGSNADGGFIAKATGGGRATLRSFGPPFDTLDYAGFELLKIDNRTGNDFVQLDDLTGTGLTQLRATFDQGDAGSDALFVGAGDTGVRGVAVGSPTTGLSIGGMVGVSVVATGVDTLSLAGGAGNDIIDASRVALGTVTQVVMSGDNGPDTTGKNTLIGSPGDDFISSGSKGPGDRIEGRDGNDNLVGGPGNDQIFGGNGDDFLSGIGGHDVLDGGPGNNVIIPEAA